MAHAGLLGGNVTNALATIYTVDSLSGQLYQGSGFVVDEAGIVATNLHVVYVKHMDARNPLLVYAGRGAYFAEIISFDADRDVALLKLNAVGFVPIELGDEKSLTPGQTISVAGPATSHAREPLSGSISRIYGVYEIIQLEVPVLGGFSGSPVIDAEGRAVGLVTFKIRYAEGASFALPIRHVSRLLELLRRKNEI